MTREKQINEEAQNYIELIKTGGRITPTDAEKSILINSFKIGAKWADAHPQSPWHSVLDADLQKNTKGSADDLSFVVVTGDGSAHLAYYGCDIEDAESPVCFRSGFDNEFKFGVKYWMEIQKLKLE